MFVIDSRQVERLETGNSRFNDDRIATTAHSYVQAIARPATISNNNNPVIPKSIPLIDRLAPTPNIIAKNSPIILTTSHLSSEDPFKRMTSQNKEEVIRKVIGESCAAEIRSVSSLKSGDTIIVFGDGAGAKAARRTADRWMRLISKQLNLSTPLAAHAVIHHRVPVFLIGTEMLMNEIRDQLGPIKLI
jgi:hypothetical protein